MSEIISMLVRQKIILHQINKAGGQISRLQLVKWAFLFAHMCNSSTLKNFYHFVPYRYGPFSFLLYHEIDMLIRNGYLTVPSKNIVRLADDISIPPLNYSLDREISQFTCKYNRISNKELIEIVYFYFPWFTIKSVQPELRTGKRPKAECAVYTIGYEGLQLDEFLNILLKGGIWQLIDIRYFPISRRYGFHKTTLSKLCQKLDIEYKHTPQLGIPSEWRSNLQHQSDYEQLFYRYENEILPVQQNVIKKVSNWLQSQPSVLVCKEANPAFCHRSCLARQISYYTGLDIRDIGGDICNTFIRKQEFSLPL